MPEKANSEGSFFRKAWNIDFSNFKKQQLHLPLVVLTFLALGYVFLEVLVFGHPGSALNLSNYQNELSPAPSTHSILVVYFPQIWLGLAILCLIFRFSVIISSYLMSKKAYEKHFLLSNMFNYFTAFIIAFIFNLVFLFFLGKMLGWLGVNFGKGINLFQYLVSLYEHFILANIPTVFNVNSYFLAFVLTIILTALPGYFVHWLSHISRFFWLIFHRCHHCPAYLHPMAAPPAFAFEFFLVIPRALVAVAISKLIYLQPLTMELSIWFLLSYCLEIFNHSIVHYDFAYKNMIVRNLCRIFGDRGVYHLIHHSAFKQDQNVNFAGGPFNIWDRIFGTYRKPYKDTPPVGLTDNPPLHLNPFRIIFGGIAQLIYELRMNPSFLTRCKIIFGSVHYMPKHTKDYLKL